MQCERHAFARRQLHFTAQVTDGVDHGLGKRHVCVGFGDDPIHIGLRIVLDHQGRFFVFTARLGNDGDLLPEFFRDERNDRVSQAKDRFQHANQRLTRTALRGFVALSHLDLRQFEVPVTVLVPNEGVDGVGSVVKTPLGHGLVNFSDRAVEFVHDPTIDEAQLHFGAGFHAAVLTGDVHQHETRGVPELVAEVAITFGTLQVEVDVATEVGVSGHRKAQCVSTVSGNAFRIVLAQHLFDLRSLFRLTKTARVLRNQAVQVDTLDDVQRVERVTFALTHLLALCVTNEAVEVHGLERHAAREVARHHDHTCHPEEDDVVARHQNGARQEEVVTGLLHLFFARPAHRREGDHSGREPRIQHVSVTRELHTLASLGLSFGFVMSNVDVAGFVVPSRDLVTPNQLTRQAPVLDVFKPLAINTAPFLRHDVDFAAFHGFKADLTDGLAREVGAFGSGLAHGHVPLFGEHRFNDFTRTRHTRYHVLVILDADQETQGFQIGYGDLTSFVAIHATILFGHVVVHRGDLRHHAHGFQTVTLTDGEVVEVVSRRDLHATGTEFTIDVFVSDHGDFTIAKRQDNGLAD